MIKRFVIAFVLLVLVAGGLVGFNLFRDQAIKQFFSTMQAPPATVSTTTVEATTWTPAIDTIGTVNAARGVDLTVQTSGIVEALLFSANERVNAGETLLQLDDEIEQADLEASKTQAELDRQSLERAIELNKRGVGSTATLEVAQAASSASAAQVQKLEALLRQKTLRAPFEGTIGIPRVEAGQYLTPGTIVATLQDLETLRADFNIPEQRLGELHIGQPIRLGLSNGELPFTGAIVGIDPKVDASSRLVAVRADIANPENRLTPGQFVQIKVELPVEAGAIALPHTAVVTSLYGDYVYMVKPAAPPAEGASGEAVAPTPPPPERLVVNQVFVKTGRRAAGLVEIKEGVAVGDQVVTAGQNRLFNGMPVTIDNTIDPSKRLAKVVAQ